MIFLYCSYFYLWHIDLYCIICTLKKELDFKSLILVLIQKQTTEYHKGKNYYSSPVSQRITLPHSNILNSVYPDI